MSSQYPPGQLYNNSIVHLRSGRGLESLLLEARHPDWELQKWLTTCLQSPEVTAASGAEDQLWKAASRAEDEGLPAVWAKPTLQQCPHGKC